MVQILTGAIYIYLNIFFIELKVFHTKSFGFFFLLLVRFINSDIAFLLDYFHFIDIPI